MWSLVCSSAVLILMSSVICGAELKVTSSSFCDEGPPGKYCLEDLSGYHDCRKNPETGKMTDTMHYCKKNTRCSCFYGPACPKSDPDPCHEFIASPKFPKRFSVTGLIKLRVCNRTKCTKYTRQEKAYLNQEDKTEQKMRLDRTVLNYRLTDIWHQKPNTEKVYQYQIRWDIKSCNRSEWSFIPDFNIDTRCTYIEKEMVGDKNTEKWMWVNGGRNRQETTHTTFWNLWKNPSTGQYQPVMLKRFDRNYVQKYKFIGTETFTFKSDFKEKVFELPDFCETDAVGF